MAGKTQKERADDLLIKYGYCVDRVEAARYIMAGEVIINDHRISKPGDMIKIDNEPQIRLKNKKEKYVSRGGLKLEKAINEFQLDFTNAIVLDIGSSTGGFVDCALQHGAARVYGVDVGTNQLDWQIRSNPAVISIENTHANDLTSDQVNNEKFDYITMDVSFISICDIIDNISQFVSEDTKLILLIKPQFEADRDDVGEGGIVNDPAIHTKVQDKVIAECKNYGLVIKGLTESPIKGTKGNTEFLAIFDKQPV